MNHIKLFEKFNKENITIPDVAWLYFLHYVYGGKLNVDSWKNDKRMGEICDVSLNKFDCVKIDNEFYRSSDDCVKIINKYFGAKTFKDAVRKQKEFEEYKSENNYHYSIDKIPYNLFLKKNPNIEKAFDRISDRIVDHFNSQRCLSPIAEKLSKSRRIKEWNFEAYWREFPDEPETFKLYRGVKGEYESKRNETGYSCWTTNKKESERFAKHYFSGGMQFSPTYTKNPHVLETELSLDDVAVFVSGDEHEVILKNPVNITNIEKIKPGDEKSQISI